ncbi:MAG: glycoside hydrolase family 28 protein [Oscillospiraceae bacterium]|nr:glycoside hydrolase family 28 protein [Oscillospiraceae bacterium]
MIELLYAGSTSACFELENDAAYYSPEGYTVLLEGERAVSGRENVFSLFDLKPDTQYSLTVAFESGREEGFSFRTARETCAIDVRSFGAVGDGVTDDTAAIQAAVNFLPRGGRLCFPKGDYLTYPLALKSHITLELAEGAVLRGSTDREGYPILPGDVEALGGGEVSFGAFEGEQKPMYQSLITAAYAEDIRIVGRGTLDGDARNGDWWKGFAKFPAARPRILFLNRCDGFVLHGVTVKDSPSWHLHPFFSKNISFLDLFITAPKQSPNTDAIDPESCDNVRIIGCRFSVGDDCVAIKSGKIDLGMKYKTPADHHTVRNCLMEFGHGALVLGSESAAGVRNLSVTRCFFRRTDRGLRIKTRRGRGKYSVITNVLFDNIVMEGVLTPLVINMWYNCCDPDRYTEYVWSREHLPVDDRTPHLGSFTFRNMTCTGAQVAACYIDGLPESPIDSVALENISIAFAPDAQPGVPAMQNFAEKRCRLGLYLDNVRSVSVRNVRLEGVEGQGLICDHCDSIETENFEVV